MAKLKDSRILRDAINDVVFYRYDAETTLTAVRLNLREFVPVKETPEGWWVKEKRSLWLSRARWVNKKPIHKSYCYPTKEEAMTSYVRRKQVYVNRLEHQLKIAKFQSELGPEVGSVPHGIAYHDC